MSLGSASLQAQVESVLGALVKAAALELVKLFESRTGASAEDAGHGEDNRENNKENNKEKQALDTLDAPCIGDTKRSIGVQVEEDFSLLLELSDESCLGEPKEMVVEGCLISLEDLLPEHNGREWSPLKDQIMAEAVDMVESSVLEAESPADNDVKTEVVLHELGQTSQGGSTPSTPADQKPIVIQADTTDASELKVKFVCPLILWPDSTAPKPEDSEKPIQAEPQQACVSTAKGTAYSPSSSDGTVTPTRDGVWERIPSPKDTHNHLQMKLKLASQDQKLLHPCAVQLVNVLTLPESELKTRSDAGNTHTAKHKSGWPLPKDLRRHQGAHTGHRLCCFTQCENGIWRLQNIVTHCRDGYICNICGKAFKHRKILRRHERFHTGERPYCCELCPKTFALRKNLRRHERFHTGERPHTCSQCGKSFRLRDNLKAHLRFHSGEKPFSCDKCGKLFRIMRNLESHQLSQCEFFIPSFRTIAGL
ncbi:oocyte zinc finger protein XlCOF29 isoform X2 [Cololabis saira]|uniref:oocyte zinc finger protein XlCOF29 isoform X2 n=1 Tax=Cololabis saira TaxID=129043 RepID=UPI002AD3E6D0|nr:oocyte zinc finger protein XlCOF29 isoform X2 [Cololabis saira]